MKKIQRDNDKLIILCDNCLLHLYSKIDSARGFTSSSARNEILVQFLKPKIKALEYKTLKKDIQLLIRIGRSNMMLESKIVELKHLALNVLNAIE